RPVRVRAARIVRHRRCQRARRGTRVARPAHGGAGAVSRRLPPVTKPAPVIAGAVGLAPIIPLLTSRPRLLPPEVIANAVLMGVPAALAAVALVLIYRSARVINFAQGAIATGASVVYLSLQVEHWPYLAAMGVAFAGAVVAGVVIEL